MSDEARADLDRIWAYTSELSGSAERADRSVAAVARRFDLICEWPQLGRLRPLLGRGVRTLAWQRWVIAYVVRDDAVVVLRVSDASLRP